MRHGRYTREICALSNIGVITKHPKLLSVTLDVRPLILFSAEISTLCQYLSKFFVPSGCFCLNTHSIYILHSYISKAKCPLLRCKTSTGSDTSFSCSVSNASDSSCQKGLYRSRFTLLGFLLKGVALRAKFRTNHSYTLHKLRNKLNAVMLRCGFMPQFASAV